MARLRITAIAYRLSPRWLWFYTAAWMLFVFALLCVETLSASPPTRLTSYFSFRFLTRLGGFLQILSLLCLASGTLLRALDKRSFRVGIVLFLPVCACMLFSIAWINLPVYIVSSVDSKSVNGYRYELMEYPIAFDGGSPNGNVFPDSVVYFLYKCDDADIFCQSVFAQKYKGGLVLSSLNKAVLLSTNEGQVSVQIGGEVVYTSEAAS